MITGASSGLGKALAHQVLNDGDIAVATFRKQDQVGEFNSHDNAYGVLLDVTNRDQVKETVLRVIDQYGEIDVLVNNAGVGFAGAVEEASLEEIRSVMEVNFFSTISLTQAVLPYMRKAKSGHIIQISSHAGLCSFPGFGVYSASKHAVEGYSEALAAELKPLGINVTIVEPGPFRTNFAGSGLQFPENEIADYAETAGAFKEKLKGVHGKQEGSPEKAAKSIVAITKDGRDTLRLPLGKIPYVTIVNKMERVKSDMEVNRDLAHDAVFD